MWYIYKIFNDMEENDIWKRTTYGRERHMEENDIWKRTTYGRERHMEEFVREVKANLGETGLEMWAKDYDVPIKYFDSGYLAHFLNRISSYAVKSKWMESLKELNREIREYTGTGEKTFKDFSKYRANVMFEVAKKIEKAEGYDCLMSMDRGKLKEEANKYRSKHGKNIYNKEFNGRKLIAVRIRDQVFQAMKQLGVKIDYNSIEDMILGNNGTKYMAESEVIQQTILGNCVPFIMNVVTDHNCIKLGELLESMGFHVEALVGNNVILAGENMNEDECRNQIAYESYCKLGFEVDVEVHEMEYIEAKNGFAIKHFKNGNFEMKKVIGNKFLQALVFTQNRRVIEEDLLFMIDEESAKYVRYCYEGVNREKKWSY